MLFLRSQPRKPRKNGVNPQFVTKFSAWNTVKHVRSVSIERFATALFSGGGRGYESLLFCDGLVASSTTILSSQRTRAAVLSRSSYRAAGVSKAAAASAVAR